MQRVTDPGPASQPLNFHTGAAKREQLPGFTPLPGVTMHVFSGGRAMMNFVTIEPGAAVGWHSHPHEQLGMVLEGEIRLTVGTEDAEPWVLRPGAVYAIAPNTPHSATTGPEGVVVLDIFAPPREDYLVRAKEGNDSAAGTYLASDPSRG